MRNFISVPILFFLFLSVANADSLVGGYPVCVTEELLDQYTQARINNDNRLKEYLKKKGCGIWRGGVPISLLHRGWTGKAKVRVYTDDDSIVVWTYIENIKIGE